MDTNLARIFVVDDEPLMQAFLLESLRNLGATDLHAFSDGAAALAAAIELNPNLILTDVHMQPLGGIELVRRMRASEDPLVRKTPVIFLSGDSSSATVSEALPLCVAGYLVKPPRVSKLAEKIETALQGLGCACPAQQPQVIPITRHIQQ